LSNVICSAAKRVRDDLTIRWCLTPCDFPPHITANQTANRHKVCCYDGVQNDRGQPIVSSQLSIHCCIRFYYL